MSSLFCDYKHLVQLGRMQVLVVDNGAWKIKAGVIVSGNGEDVIQKPRCGSPICYIHVGTWPYWPSFTWRMVTNGIVRQTRGEKRTFFGHEFDHCKDHSSLHFRLPFERVHCMIVTFIGQVHWASYYLRGYLQTGMRKRQSGMVCFQKVYWMYASFSIPYY